MMFIRLMLVAKHCFITPHIAWATRAARERMMKTVVANVLGFLAGRPQNVVNSETATGLSP